MRLQKQWFIAGILFVLPAIILYCTFTYYPFIKSIYYSFTSWDTIRKPIWIGWDNYKYLFHDRKIMASFSNTLKMVLFGLFFQNFISIWLAVLLNRKFLSGQFLRTAIYFPCLISLVVLSVIWSQILSVDGTFNTILNYLGMGNLATDWLGKTGTVFNTIILLTQWQGVGYCVIFYLAGLQSIPAEIYDAAHIDGAGAFHKFWRITLPLLMPTITIVTFLIIVGSLRLFDIPYVLTNGGPGTASYTLSLAIYNSMGDAGYSMAGGIVLMILLAGFTYLQLHITRRMEVQL